MAVDMRLSLREHSPHPVALGADAKIAVIARDDFPGVFDEVVVMDDRYGVHRAMQFGAGQVSPFDHTLFIDADCFVLSDPDGLGQLTVGQSAKPEKLVLKISNTYTDVLAPDWRTFGFARTCPTSIGFTTASRREI